MCVPICDTEESLKKLPEPVLLIQVDIASYWDTLVPKKPIYQKLEFGAPNTLTIKPLYKKLLLENAKIAKQFYERSLIQIKYKKQERLALNILKQQVLLYERLRVLTAIQKQELVRIVDGLINK
jgi:hypothetical protein